MLIFVLYPDFDILFKKYLGTFIFPPTNQDSSEAFSSHSPNSSHELLSASSFLNKSAINLKTKTKG